MNTNAKTSIACVTGLLLAACAETTTHDTPVQRNAPMTSEGRTVISTSTHYAANPHDAATAPAANAAPDIVTAETLAQLKTMLREANALKTPLAMHDYYLEHYEKTEGGLQNVIAQMLAASESELGDYESAVQAFPLNAPGVRDTPALLPTAADFRAVDAVDGIATLAQTRRIVLINEAHHIAQTRLLTLALLPRLRALGFTHFAVEGLDERDRDLVARGYPTNASGLYVREPLYGEIIRTALKLGFVVVPYDSTTPDTAVREEEQAQHIVDRVFRTNPSARLFVHGGYAHGHKRTGYISATPMGLHLRQMTGFDPLVIDQTMLRPVAPLREYKDYPELVQRFEIHSPTIFLAKSGGLPWSLEPTYYDVSVVLPSAAHWLSGRADWLTLDGARVPVTVKLDPAKAHMRYVVEARYANEGDSAVPADRVPVLGGSNTTVATDPTAHAPVEGNSDKVVLFLRPGDYRLTEVDANGQVLSKRALHVDAAANGAKSSQ